MNTFRLIMRQAGASARTALAAGCGLGLFAVSSFAQSGTGVIRGRVLNETTGEYLEGAVVQVVGSGQTVSTNLQGYFEIRGVPEGSTEVKVSYLGLGEKAQSVEVSSEVSRVVELALSEDIVELDGVRVEASLTGRSSAINQQRVAKGIKNIVNQDDFGQMNDGNLGMAIRRMPGLSVDTDGGTEVPRYVNIRGFDASLNSVTLDGNKLPSSEDGSPSQRGGGTAYGGAARAFALDDVPADSITNVEISKSPTPDMDGAALGGSVNLVTKTAFERNGRSIDYRLSGSYSKLRGEYGYNGALTYSDLVSVFGGDRNLGISFSLSQYDQSEGFDNIDYDYVYLSHSDDGLDLTGIRPGDGPVNDYLKSNIDADRARTGQIVIGFNEDTEYNNYEIDRKRFGFSSSIDLKANDRTELFLKTTFAKENRVSTDLRHHLIMDSSDSNELNHGDAATPLNQYVSYYGSWEPQFNAGNWSAFRSRATALGRASENFAPGATLPTADGGTITFDPGALVRLGTAPGHISTIHPDTTDLRAYTTYSPTGAARGKVRYEGTFREDDINLWYVGFGGKTSFDWGRANYGVYTSSNEKEGNEYQHEYERRGFQFSYERFADDPYRTNYITENASQVSRFEVPNQADVDRFIDLDLEYKERRNVEDYSGLNLDVEYDLPSGDSFRGFIKGGLRYTAMERSYDYDEKEWDLASAFPFADYLYMNELEGPYKLDRYKIPYVPDAPRIYNEALPANPTWFSEQYAANLNDSIVNDYTAKEDTTALYLMGDLSFGEKLSVIVGARYESVDFETTGYELDGEWRVNPTMVNPLTIDERTAVAGVYTSKRSYNEFLPSVHFKYTFSEKLIARFSAGKTYAKPAIKDMVGSLFIDEEQDADGTVLAASLNVPNFDLPTQTSKNLDLSLEYYTDASGRFGAGLFRKDMNNFAWEESFTTVNYPGYQGIPVTVSQPVANTDAVNQGIEFFVDQKLVFLPEFWQAFAVSGSYTYTDSEAQYYTGRVGPTIGHSRNMYTASVSYDRGPFFARLIWQYRDPFFENISISDFAGESEALAPELQYIFDDTFMNPGTLDMELAYAVNDKLKFFVNGTNLLEGINASRQGFFAYPEDSYPHETRWTFGVKGRF